MVLDRLPRTTLALTSVVTSALLSYYFHAIDQWLHRSRSEFLDLFLDSEVADDNHYIFSRMLP